MSITRKIQVRRGTTSQWSTANPTLSSGEIGYDSTVDKIKIGDGATAWNSLAFAHYTPSEVDAVVNAAITRVFDRTGLLESTGNYIRWEAEGGGEFQLSSDQVSDTDNVFRIERNDGTIVERIWDGINFYVEWVPLGVQVGTWGVTDVNVNGDKLTAATAIAPAGCTLHLKPKHTYNIDFPVRPLDDLTIEGNWATIKRRDQRSSLLTANSNAGTSTVTVADASVFRIGMRAFVVKTPGVLGGHAMVNGTTVTAGSAGFLITNIVGNVVTLGGSLQQNCVIGNKLVALDQMMVSNSSTANVEIRNAIFDGNNSSHADVLDWAAGYGVALGFATVKNCVFRNSPNETLTIGAGSVENCKAYDCFGSFFHASIAGDGSNATGILIQNCYAKNVVTKDGGHTEGVIALSANSRNIRVVDCVFDNSAGTRGTGVFGILDAFLAADRDDNFYASNVVAKNYGRIALLSTSTGTQNFSRFVLEKCTFESCGQLLVHGTDVTNGPFVEEVKVEACQFVNCWMDFRHIRFLTLADNTYTWDLYSGVFAGIAGAVVNLPANRIGGGALAEGDASAAVLAGAANGIYIRTSGAWVKDETASARLPGSSVFAAILIQDCGFVDIHGGYYSSPGFKVNNSFNAGIWLNPVTRRVTEAGTTNFYYMQVSIDDVYISGFQIGVGVSAADTWTTTSPTYDAAGWIITNVTVETMRCNIYFNTLGIEVPGGGVARNCNVFLSDTSTLSTSIGIKLNGPVDATKHVGGAAINCYVPNAPGSSEAIRLGRNADNARNKNCIAVGNVIAKAVALAGTHDSVQDNNTVISLTGMTSPTVPPWRPVGANENLY